MARTQRRTRFALRVESLEAKALLSFAPIEPLGLPVEVLRPDNSLIVGFRVSAPESKVSTIASVGGRLARSVASGADVLVFDPGTDLDAVAARLGADPSIRYVERNLEIKIDAVPNDPMYAQLWALGSSAAGRINAPAAWDLSIGSSLVTVAVTDTGVDYNHPDLYLNIWVNQDELPANMKAQVIDTNGDGQIDFYDFNSLDALGNPVLNAFGSRTNAGLVVDANGDGRISGSDLLADPRWVNGADVDGNGRVNDLVGVRFIGTPTNNPLDDHWHGTHVAGTIGATGNNNLGVVGVNWRVRLMPVKFLNSKGSGTTADGISSIVYAAEQGARVINASWGSQGTSTAIRDAIAYAGSLGSVFVAAAGNDAANNDVTPYSPGGVRLPTSLTVAAIASSGSLASFSNYGAQTVDLAAPGQSITSTVLGTGYGTASGTSMAAPHVAGAVALLAAYRPELTAEQLVTRIKATALPTAALANRVLTSGQLDLAAALAAPGYSAPGTLHAAPESSSSIRLTWPGISGGAGYAIERNDDGGSGWTRIASVSRGTTTFLDTGLTSGATYSYRIRGTGPSGETLPGPVVSATVRRPSQAVLVTSESSTGGNWVGRYGLDGYQLAGGSAWTYSGSAGVATNGSAFTSQNPSAPDGDQVLFIQGTGTAEQTLLGWPAGTYTLSLKAARRGNTGGSNDFRIVVNGSTVGTFRPTSTSYTTFTTNPFTLVGGPDTIRIEGINSTGGSNTALLDSLFLQPANAEGPPPLPQAGFESPTLGNSFVYRPTGTAWTFSGSSGISGNRTAFTSGNPPAPEGTQVLFIQRTGTAEQTVSGWPAGTYTLSLKAARRGNTGGPNDFRILVNGTTVGTFRPTSTSYSSFTTNPFALLGGPDTIRIEGINSAGGENTAFVDDLLLTPIASAMPLLADPGFELPDLSTGFVYRPSTLLAAPSWVSPQLSGQTTRVWADTTTDSRGLRKSAATTARIAAAWTSPTRFEVDVPLADATSRRVTLAMIDWEGAGRSQRIEVIDPSTSTVIGSHDLSSFQSGVYLTWEVLGPVRFRISNLSGPNAVLNGIFFDASPLTAPTGLTASSWSTSAIDLAWAPSPGATAYKVERSADGLTGWSVVGMTEGGVTSYRDIGLPAGTSFGYRVRAAGPGGDSLASPVAWATTRLAAVATFLGRDTTTQGNWVGAYGASGYRIVGGAWWVPAFTTLTTTDSSAHTWAATTTETRALRRSLTDSSRVAASLFSTTNFSLNVPIQDGSVRKVSLYLIDWNGNGSRQELVEVLDASTGQVIDSRTVSTFQNGVYLSWKVSGSVTFRITSLGTPNAVLSGVFFD